MRARLGSRNCCCATGSCAAAGRRGPLPTRPRLLRQSFPLAGTQSCVRGRLRRRRAHHQGVGTGSMPRSRGDGCRLSVHPGGAPPVVPARNLRADGGCLAVESATGSASPVPVSARTWGLCLPSTPPGLSIPGVDHQDRGNSHVRRMLVRSAWHHRKPYRPRPSCGDAGAGLPAAVARAHAGSHRLHQRWITYARHKKRPDDRHSVAVARELAGWCWSLAMLRTERPHS